MRLCLAKLQNLLWRYSFAQTAQFTTHARMAWKTAYINYGISRLCKAKELTKVLV